MKERLIKVFWPVLAMFEKGEPAVSFRPSHRKILLAVGLLFLVLFSVSLFFAFTSTQLGAVIPALVFGAVSAVSILVSSLGSDVAVARIWGLK
jgi:hypothetical protein